MGTSLHSITNWLKYNKSLINCGSLTFWVDADLAICCSWCELPCCDRENVQASPFDGTGGSI